MESMAGIQCNKTKIMDIGSFVGFKGIAQDGNKEVCFVRGTGVHGGYLSEIERMDSSLMMEMNQGKGLYNRITELPVMKNAEDISFYSNVYDEWVRSGKNEMRMNITREDSGKAAKLSNVCLTMEEIFQRDKKQTTGTMVKNFIVKLLFWYESVLKQNGFCQDDTKIMKLVASNIEKRQEYLFFYMMSLLGINVLLLQSKADIGDEEEKLGFSQKFVLGEYKDVKVPAYHWQPSVVISQPVPEATINQNALNNNGRVTVKIPERNRPNRPTNTTTPAGPAGANSSGPREEKSFEELALLASSVVLITVFGAQGERLGSGSGIMIGKDGYILTNNHVAAGGRSFSVRIEDDDMEYRTNEIIKYHSVLDLAIIRIQRKLTPIPVYNGTKPLVRGQKVVAIGSPLGLFNSVSNGIISGFRKIDDVDMIQFTAPISRGSSGGAVLNMQGEVVGISTAEFVDGQNINLAMGYECINMFIRGFI